MEKMLVTQALNELKTLDARIDRAIKNANFVAAAKTNQSKVYANQTKEEFITEAKASWNSINDLINRRETIKSAIVESNAKTMVEICGQNYSVAKVIDMKNSIEYKRDLLNSMKEEYSITNSNVVTANREMETKIDNLVSTAFGKESKQNIKEDDYNSIANPYRVANETSLVDPLNIKDKIDELENWIEEFDATVDSKLQISNCITFIEF